MLSKRAVARTTILGLTLLGAFTMMARLAWSEPTPVPRLVNDAHSCIAHVVELYQSALRLARDEYVDAKSELRVWRKQAIQQCREDYPQ